MKEHQLRALIEDVRSGQLPRRGFIQQMVGLGLSAPMASMMLMHAGIAQAQPKAAYKPTKRGGGGPLKTLWWQAPTLLQPHFAAGTKDQEASRVFYEPLAVWDNDGNLVPILAAEIPTVANGGLLEGGKVVRWRLKKGVTWHDGKPFTADDCVFTWEYVRDPATAAVTSAVYKDITVTKVDDYTILVSFRKPTPFWATAFVAAEGMIIPKHLFEAYSGAKSRDAPTNLKPVGTGAYKFVDFKPGDLVLGTINTSYHVPNQPFFDSIEMKGGGDATSAARAVLQTGEYDYAWNMQVEDEVLKRMEAGGKGKAHIVPSGDIEFIQVNITDPVNEVDGERASAKSHHFAFSDPVVRQAMSLLADRKAMQEFIYGRTGIATSNFMNNPPRFRSPNTKWEFNVDKANTLLDGAGWKKGSDGIREKGGKKMKFVFQTSINPTRQKDAGGLQAGLPEGRHRPRAEVGDGVGVLLDRRRQSRHLSEVLGRPADVHHDHDAARRAALHGPVPLDRDLAKGQQVAGPEHLPLDEPGVRHALPFGRGRARSGQARGDLHQVQRHGGERQHHHPVDQPAARVRRRAEARDHALGLGPRLLADPGLVPGSLIRSPPGSSRTRSDPAVGHFLLRRLLMAVAEPARHQHRAVRGAGAGAGRSVLGHGAQPEHPGRGAAAAAHAVRSR